MDKVSAPPTIVKKKKKKVYICQNIQDACAAKVFMIFGRVMIFEFLGNIFNFFSSSSRQVISGLLCTTQQSNNMEDTLDSWYTSLRLIKRRILFYFSSARGDQNRAKPLQLISGPGTQVHIYCSNMQCFQWSILAVNVNNVTICVVSVSGI